LAIGKKGQNVRLAARLTGWKIDVLTGERKVAEVKEAEIKSEESADAKKEKKTDEKILPQSGEDARNSNSAEGGKNFGKKETKKTKKPKKDKK